SRNGPRRGGGLRPLLWSGRIPAEVDIAAPGRGVATHRNDKPVSYGVRYRHAIHGNVRWLDGNSILAAHRKRAVCGVAGAGRFTTGDYQYSWTLVLLRHIHRSLLPGRDIDRARIQEADDARYSESLICPNVGADRNRLSRRPLLELLFDPRTVVDPPGFRSIWIRMEHFGTAQFRPDIGIVGARFVWYTSLFAIVIGHVAAVSLAHIVALRSFDDHRLAIRSQIPMLVLMVAYTMMSLWIIAQAIVE